VGETNRPEDKDVISELADAGEDALRRLVDIPRRVLAGARDTADEWFQDIATRLRAIDPLERRVTALEKRLDSLEAPETRTARTASGQAKRSSPRTVSKEASSEPVPAGRSDEGGAGDERGQVVPEAEGGTSIR
jgi:hypothetical protein